MPLNPRQELTPAPYALALPGLRTTPSGFLLFPAGPNVIGGDHDNSIDPGAGGATIAGGGAPGVGNTVFDSFNTVGGGRGNEAGSDDADASTALYATVGGGSNNRAIGGSSTIGGGSGNAAGGSNSTVSGGGSHTANGDGATVGGGSQNHADGTNSTVPGGFRNNATGSGSFAAGRRAMATQDGAFVWADNSAN